MNNFRLGFLLASAAVLTPAYGEEFVPFTSWQNASRCLGNAHSRSCLTDQQRIVSLAIDSVTDVTIQDQILSGKLNVTAAPHDIESELQVAALVPTFKEKISLARPIVTGAWLKNRTKTLPLKYVGPTPDTKKVQDFGQIELHPMPLDQIDKATLKVHYLYLAEIPETHVVIDPSAGELIKNWAAQGRDQGSTEDLAKALLASGLALTLSDPHDFGSMLSDAVAIPALSNLLSTHVLRTNPATGEASFDQGLFQKLVAEPTKLQKIAYTVAFEESLSKLLCDHLQTCQGSSHHILDKEGAQKNLATIAKFVLKKDTNGTATTPAFPEKIEEFGFEIRNITLDSTNSKIGYIVPKTVVSRKKLAAAGIGLERLYVFPSRDQIARIKEKHQFMELRPLQSLTKTEFFTSFGGKLELLGEVSHETLFSTTDPQLYGLDWQALQPKLMTFKKITIRQHWRDNQGTFLKDYDVIL